jgi:two-component system cell cycle sensor histidine kinase/response regulator CckA
MLLLFGVAAVITGFMALCLLFFQATRKTYPGFGYWTAGVAILALGYLLYALRGQIPLWSSVFLGTAAFPLGLVFHLDGIRRFLGLKPASILWYALPAGVLGALAVFYFQWNSAVWRGLVASVPITAIHWTMAALLFRNAVSSRSTFYQAIGSLLALGGLLIIARAIWLVSSPNPDLLWKAPLEFAFFISFIVIHLGENLSLIMLNAERVEHELLEAEADLIQKVRSIEEALAQQKQAEESLRESEERYRTFFDTSRDCVFMTRLDGRFIEFNDVGQEMLGYAHSQREEVLGRPVSDLYAHPEEREAHAAMVAEIGFSKEYPVDLRKQDGTIIHTLITTVARKDPLGNTIGFQGTVRDVTERSKAEEELKNQVSLVESLLEAIPAPVFFKNTDHVYMGCNEAFAQFIGLTKEKIIGKSVFDVAPEEHAEVYRSQDEILFHNPGSQVYESSVESTDGSMRNVVFHKATFEDSSGAVAGLIGVILDVTDRKNAEDSLRESKDTLETILNNIPVMVAFLDRHGSHKYVNQCWQDTLGWSLEEVLKRDVLADLYPDPEYKEHVRDYIAQAGGNWGDFDTVTREGRLIKTSWVNVQLADGSNIGIGLDITERKIADEEREQLRNQLFQAQKMEAMGTLTGGIAHDFNNLLTIINGYTEMVLSEKTEDDPIYPDLQKVLETGRKGAELVQRLLALSKKGESSPEPLEINRIVENSLVLMERSFPKMIEIETILEKDLGTVNADFAQIEQVLMNLCINAKEAMPDGGRLRIGTRNFTVDEGYCRLHPERKPGHYVLMEVEDTGIGMNKETLDRIFDPFFTTKGWDFNKGTGLGLSVAKGIVEQHGGWITCESELGVGTKFTVYFPAIETQPEHKKSETETTATTECKKILLVDDEEYIRDLGKRILERAGYDMITASNGKEALEIYSREQSNISLVILDLIMPQMDGEKCLEEFLKKNPTLRVVVSSGHSLDSKEMDRLSTYAKGFVDKPYQMKEFMQVVKEVLDAE